MNKRYKVKKFLSPVPEDVFEIDAWEKEQAQRIKETYGLQHLPVQEIHRRWKNWSRDMFAGWMEDHKRSVELIFNVELEEIHKLEVISKEDQEVCEHEFDSSEGNLCLNCGKDGTEDLIARAESLEDR